MKYKSKLFGLLAIITMLVPLFVGGIVGGAARVDEVPANVKVSLFKKAFKADYQNIQNTGETMDFPGEALKDVKFKAYDISDTFYKIQKEEKLSATATIQKIQGMANAIEEKTPQTGYETLDKIGTFVGAEKVTDDEGQATWDRLPTKGADGKYKVYMFIESFKPANVTQSAAPLIVSMPVRVETEKGSGVYKYLNDISLYPKNKIAEEGKKELKTEGLAEVTVSDDNENKTYGTQVGAIHDYTITTTIPAGIADASEYVVTDTPKPAGSLDFQKGSLAISGVTLEPGKDNDYDVFMDNTTGGFKIEFNVKSATLFANRGKQLTITYKMKVTDKAETDQTFTNDATVKVGDESFEYHTPNLVYGGHKFEKVDKNTGKALAGVEFAITARDDKLEDALYFKKDSAGIWSLSSKGVVGATTVLVTDEKGGIEVKGLAYGDYDFHETKAKGGYVPLTEPVKFTVAHAKGETVLPTKVENIEEGILPSTGGTGIIAFLAVGAALMAGAFIWYRKSKVNEEV